MGLTSYSYDYEDRLTGTSYPSAATNAFAYNAFDIRVGKTDSAGTATFMRDGVGVCSPVLSDGNSSFTPGVSQRSGSASTFQAMDRLGTFSVETNASQSVTATRQFDAFGNPTGTTGTPTTPFAFAGAWGYQQDSDSGLMLLGHRYYDASTGRFLTRDPANDGRNWYGYCDNNPLKRIDPAGFMTLFGFEFTWGGFKDGINTGIHGLGSGMTFGLYDGGDCENDPGFGGSKILGGVASSALLAAGAVAVLPAGTLITASASDTVAVDAGASVIGRGMVTRVVPFAMRNGLNYIFRDFLWDQRITWLENFRWILACALSGKPVVDIGTGGTGTNWWYGMEWVVTRALMKPSR